MRLNSNFVIHVIADEHLAIPTGPNYDTFHGIVSLNEPVSLLLQAMQNRSLSKENMISILTDQYLVDSETAAADLDVLIRDLTEMGLIET